MKSMKPKEPPKWKLLLDLMSHGGWVSMRAMADVAGYRYGARLDDLKKKGWDHEYRARGESGELEYRLFPMAPPPGQMRLDLHTQEALRT